MDTQWDRYEVFVQEKAGKPHEAVGSVHAADGELAQMNARDVFARRPEAVSMWVAPAGQIYAQTREQLARRTPPTGDTAGPSEPYEVFIKEKSAGTHSWLAQVEARSPIEALDQARQSYPDRDPFTWWVLPSRCLIASSPDEVDSLYAPARDKKFRQSTDFHTHTAMRGMK